MKAAFLDKLIGRIRHLQPEDVQAYLLELAREKGFLETIFDAIEEGVIVTNLEGRILYLNRSACELFGLKIERALGRPISEQVRGLDWEQIADSAGAVIREMEVFYPKSIFLNFYVAPLLSDNGKDYVGRAIILRDVTETRKATQETIESERFSALTLLAAGVAHEIGNPLNSLGIHLTIAERRLNKLPEEARKELASSLHVAKEEVARLDHIITQFLRAIRPTPLQAQPENLNLLIEESMAFFAHEFRDRDILVEAELGAPIPLLPLDRDQIRQAFYNVIRNGLQAMKDGGVFRIHSGVDDTHAWVTFSDTGAGISLQQMSRVFEPYFSTKSDGTGLGLLIVRRIVREHGGEVMMESGDGKGLTLTIRFPLRDRSVRLLPPASQKLLEEASLSDTSRKDSNETI